MSLLKCVWGTQQALSKGMDGTRQVSLEMDASREETVLASTRKLELVTRKKKKKKKHRKMTQNA